MAPDRATARHRKAIPAAPDGNIQRPPNRQILIKGLRHTHATLLLELGVHPKVVQERLGHSTITTTMNIYSHVTPTMQRAAIDRLTRHLNGA